MGAEDFKQPEAMAEFFDLRAFGYDEHIRGEVFSKEEFENFYQAVAFPIPGQMNGCKWEKDEYEVWNVAVNTERP